MIWFYMQVAKGVAKLPLTWAHALAVQVGWVLAHVLRVRRAYVLQTLERCLPGRTPEDRKAIYAALWRHQALNVMELMRFAGGRDTELAAIIDVHGEEIIQTALARGKGVLILNAHIGNYVLLGVSTAKVFGYPLSAVYKPLKSPLADRLWLEIRRRGGMAGIPAHNAYRACVRSLRKNELVGFMLDQNRPVEQGVFVDFFGRPASTSPGLAFMSAQTGAPVVPVFMHRTPDGRHVLEVHPLIEPPPDRKKETLLERTALYTRVIEQEIRRRPEQWLWLHKRWKSRPRPPEADT